MFFLSLTKEFDMAAESFQLKQRNTVLCRFLPILNTCFSPYLACSKIDDGSSKCPNFSYTTAAVPNHATSMSQQLDELVEWNIFYCTEIWVMLNAFLPHYPNHFFAPYDKEDSKSFNAF